MKPKTLNAYRSHLFTFFGWMVDRQLIAENPLKAVKAQKAPKADSQRSLSLEELQRRSLVSSLPSLSASLKNGKTRQKVSKSDQSVDSRQEAPKPQNPSICQLLAAIGQLWEKERVAEREGLMLLRSIHEECGPRRGQL